MMQDLKYIEQCPKCKHNLSYDEEDVKKGYVIRGYTIKYKEYGSSKYSYKLVRDIDSLGREIHFLTSLGYPDSYYRDYSGTKICEILRYIEEYTYIKCPKCESIIVLKNLGTRNIPYDWWGGQRLSKMTLLDIE